MSDELNEVWELYAEEGNRSLDEAETILLSFQRGDSDPAAIAALFRAMHTFKGNARVMALSVIESRAHLAEDLIGLVRDEGVVLDAAMSGLLLETVDVLRGMLEDSLLTHQDVNADSSTALSERLRLEYAMRREDDHVMPVSVSGSPPDPVTPTAHTLASDLLPLPDDPAVAPIGYEVDEEISAIVFDDDESLSLADDPVYRQIYAEMVGNFLARVHAALGEELSPTLDATAHLTAEAEQLCHAAGQMGFVDWAQVLEAYIALDFPGRDDLTALLDQFTAMAQRDFSAHITIPDTRRPSEPDLPYAEQALTFFTSIQALLDTLSTTGSSFDKDDPASTSTLVHLLNELQTAVEAGGFPGPAPIIGQFLETLHTEGFDPRQLEAMEFALYESLAAIQNLSLAGRSNLPVDAAAIVRLWCVERLDDSLQSLADALKTWVDGISDIEQVCAAMAAGLYRVYHACQQYGLSTAEELCMVLVDLFERVRTEEMVMDDPLITLTRSFLDNLDTAVTDLTDGQPEKSTIFESLLAEAGQFSFTLSHTQNPEGIEITLGLPPAFHKVMTPESVRMAEDGLERGLSFYILRVDLNSEEDMANRFLKWMHEGEVEAVSNVTVFEGQHSRFDFLVMTALSQASLCAALQILDPAGHSLCIEQVLYSMPPARSEAASSFSEEIPLTLAQSDDDQYQDEHSTDLLESIGELVTAQAMVMHLLTDLEKEDVIRAIERSTQETQGDWPQIQSTMRQHLDDWRDKIEKLLQVETRVNTLLDSLQQAAISMRSRSAGLLLNPMVSWLESLARQHHRSVRLVIEGEETRVDLEILQQLSAPLRSLLAYSALHSVESTQERVASGKPPQAEIRLSLIRAEDHLRLMIRDDGRGIDTERVGARLRQLGWIGEAETLDSVMLEGFGPIGNGETEAGLIDFAELRENLRLQGNELYLKNRDVGGWRCVMIIPLALVVMEGMVVRVGEIRYVIPIDSIQRIIHTQDDALTHLAVSHGHSVLRLSEGDLLPVQYLMRSGNGATDPVQIESRGDGLLFVVVGGMGKRVAVSVDELIGQQQILIRPLQGYLSKIRGVMGCALLGSGDIGMVLNIGYVIAH
ncbi:MAG: chemotaxis protein CheW [Methylococcaceae bacterium]